MVNRFAKETTQSVLFGLRSSEDSHTDSAALLALTFIAAVHDTLRLHTDIEPAMYAAIARIGSGRVVKFRPHTRHC